MFRYNLIVAGLVAAISLSSSANEDGEAADAAAPSAVELKLPAGFTLEEKKLTLPTGQTVENVTGLQECGKMLLIVSQRDVGVYNPRQKQYSVLSRSMRLDADSELILIPFNAAVSNDPKAGERTAFIAVKRPDSLLTGAYRYRVGKPGLEHISIFGGHIKGLSLKGQFTFWRNFKKDDGSTGIGLDITHPSTKYLALQRYGDRELLMRITPPTREQVEAYKKAVLAKLPKEKQQEPVPVEPPADSTPVQESPEE